MGMILVLIDQYVPQKLRKGRILDIGCGTGLMLKQLAELKPVGIDFSQLALEFTRQRNITNLVRGNVVQLPFKSNSLDLVLALDLMEHIKDDAALAREIHRVLAPGGCLVVTVPAHEFLWSDHDEALHHFRRYSYPGFKKLMKSAGLKPRKYSYGISFTYYPIVIFRMFQKTYQKLFLGKRPREAKSHLIPLPTILNRLMIGLLQVEAKWLRKRNLPVGVSLMGVFQKPRRRKSSTLALDSKAQTEGTKSQSAPR